MADTEEYFPRGGKKPTTLFKQSANFLGAPEKADKKRKKLKKRSEDDDGYLSDDATKEIDQSAKNCAIGLSYNTIKEGVLVLGRVRSVFETKMTVMLPCKLMGNVMACHISEAYNKLLEDYVNDKAESVMELSKMFKPGQYICTKVLEVNDRSVMLSVSPQHVNGGKTTADIIKGTLFQAAVSSVEDHGYVMDLGIPNTTTFLPKKDVNPDLELEVGMVTWCAVKSVTSSQGSCVCAVSCAAGAVQGALLRNKPQGAPSPGAAVEFTVETPLENGIEGLIFGDTSCYIQRQHVDKVKGKKPTLGQKIRGRVLYVLPTRNTPFLTMKNIFESAYPDMEKEQTLKDGDIVEEAQVLKIIGRSVHFKLGLGNVGVLGLKRIQIDEELTDEDVIAKSYPLGSKHRVRVLCYNMSDYVYSVTDQPHIVNEPYFNYEQLSVGEIVQATVTLIDEKHAELQVGRVKGYVPHTHLTEAGVFIDPKKARISNVTHKKYKVGQQVTARVLSLDPSKQQLILTLKPSLLSTDLEVLKSYQDAVIGKAYTGIIRYIKDYLLVSFFNNVVAYIPRDFVTQDRGQNLAEAFHLGQIVTCTIISVRLDANRMSGSLVTAPFNHDENRNKMKRKQTTSETETPHKKHKNKQTDKKQQDETNNKSKTENRHTEEYLDLYKEESQESKRKKKAAQEKQVSEESDAIETDVYEEDEVLTPHEQGLLDMTDCASVKHYKKRLVALTKAVDVRERRSKVVGDKIAAIEARGLNAKNKKYHSAMHNEKLTIQDRIEKLSNAKLEVLDKMKELGYERNENYKEEQKKRKLEKKLAKKEGLKEEVGTIKKEREVKSVDVKGKMKDIKVAIGLEPALDIPSAKDFFAPKSFETIERKEDSSSSDDETAEQPKKKRKKLSVAEKLSKVRAEEERIRFLERASAEDAAPRSVDQFERALLSEPASSQLWIAYMAFHLQSTELDKARAVARKALAAIPFREELDKLNVWLALLNLEHRFGTQESQQKTLEDALQMNEPYKVHSALLDIYVETGKPQELSTLAELMQRKYKRQPAAYVTSGAACYKLGLLEKARQLMQKAVAVLEKKEHVSILVQFALLERKYGGRERAEALFEQVLAVYPQRVDVCSTYVDMLVKDGDIEQVRQVLDRMTSLKLPARKMKILYKKWIEVEEKLGDEKQVDNIKQRAMEFIEKAKF